MARTNPSYPNRSRLMQQAWLRRIPWSEALRFGAMGLLSGGIYLLILYPIRKYVPGPLWFLGGIAYVLSMAANYVLQRRVTFRSKRRHQEAITRFVAVQLTALVINSVILDVLVRRQGYPFWYGQGVAVVTTSAFSYVAQKIWVFWNRDKATN